MRETHKWTPLVNLKSSYGYFYGRIAASVKSREKLSEDLKLSSIASKMV